jgi:hypothetical protein
LHRAAPASPPVYLELVATSAETAHLEVVAELEGRQRRTLQEQVLALLTAGVVQTRAKLRQALAVKNERLGEALELLQQAGWVRHMDNGWQRIDCIVRAVPVPPIEIKGNGTAILPSSHSRRQR